VVVEAVVVVVEVVVGTVQLGPLPGVGQASQQLAQVPTVPCIAVQCAASFLILHLVPLADVIQQVTAPAGFPQIEWDAHFLVKPAQLGLVRTVFTCWAAQLTYAPWVNAPAQSQLAVTAARAFAMSVLSGSVLGSHAARAGTLLMNTEARAASTRRVSELDDDMRHPCRPSDQPKWASPP
jgi:hypothetical protein